MLICSQSGREVFNADYARNIFVTSSGEIKIATDFSRGGLIGKYADEDAAKRALTRIMNSAAGGEAVIKAPEEHEIRGRTSKAREHFADGSVQKGHGGS